VLDLRFLLPKDLISELYDDKFCFYHIQPFEGHQSLTTEHSFSVQDIQHLTIAMSVVTVAELFRFPSPRSRSLQHMNMKASLVQIEKGKEVCLRTEMLSIPEYSHSYVIKKKCVVYKYSDTGPVNANDR